jgi:plastocyanin
MCVIARGAPPACHSHTDMVPPASISAPGRRVPIAVALLATLGAPTAVRGEPAGRVTGVVRFAGELPDRPRPRRDTDPYCARLAAPDDDVVVTDGKLRDVLVRITPVAARRPGAPPAAPSAVPPPAVIDQKDCAYLPRVVGLVAGQQLAVRNSDGTFHNVHGTIGGKLAWNRPASPGDPELTLDGSARAGDVIDIVCDVHPWMRAYAVVVDRAPFTVTGADGAFTLTGLGPGGYVVEAWHPILGTKQVRVTIGRQARPAATAQLTYQRSDAR